MKWMKKIFIALFIFLFLITGTLLVIAFAYENEVKDYMIQQLNKHLKTQVIVDSKNINLSLLRNFPYASLEFKDVKMLGSPVEKKESKRDTLFALEKVFLEFNVFDILRKNYVVKKIKAENGTMKLKMGINGTVNWDIWKGDSAATASREESAFNLEKFQLNNIELQYLNYKNKNDFSFQDRKSTRL